MDFTKEDIEQICMEMISLAGEGRSYVHEAIEAFSAEDYKLCQEKIEQAESFLVQAHQIQFDRLIKSQAQGVDVPFHLLLIHAMDLVMVSTSEKDVIKKLLAGKLQ